MPDQPTDTAAHRFRELVIVATAPWREDVSTDGSESAGGVPSNTGLSASVYGSVGDDAEGVA